MLCLLGNLKYYCYHIELLVAMWISVRGCGCYCDNALFIMYCGRRILHATYCTDLLPLVYNYELCVIGIFEICILIFNCSFGNESKYKEYFAMSAEELFCVLYEAAVLL